MYDNEVCSQGFSPENDGEKNRLILQKALDRGGTVVIARPGTYRLAGTVFIGSHTTLTAAAGVFIEKDAHVEPFTHVLLNKGALDGTWDENIVVEGLNIIVNGVDVRRFLVYGLHGQIAFFRVRDLLVRRFRCTDLGPAQYGIHVCTFENIIIDDVRIEGLKDGVHLGRGSGFTIRNGVFRTYDDAVALNGHDYSVGNPELGWIENGIVENCVDLDAEDAVGYFCRILAGAWIDWREGMEVQQSDSVVSDGRVYRVQMEPDGKNYVSRTRPTHTKGSAVLDGITWGVVQNDACRSAGVRNVTFRDIFLHKGRTAFSIHFDTGRYSRSFYPGAETPVQEKISFDNIRVLHDYGSDFIRVNTPIDRVSIVNSWIKRNPIRLLRDNAMKDYGITRFLFSASIFETDDGRPLLIDETGSRDVRLEF